MPKKYCVLMVELKDMRLRLTNGGVKKILKRLTDEKLASIYDDYMNESLNGKFPIQEVLPDELNLSSSNMVRFFEFIKYKFNESGMSYFGAKAKQLNRDLIDSHSARIRGWML